MKQLHDIQLEILKKLLFQKDGARHIDIKPDKKIENNKFQFHLNVLIDKGYIEKGENGYALTAQGKEYAGRIDTEGSLKVIKQSKIGCFVCPIRKNNEGEMEVLMYTRTKQPLYGYQGLMSGKVEYGESIIEGAAREFTEETGLVGTPEIIAIRHYINKDSEGSAINDMLIFWCRVLEPQGEIKSSHEGDFFWIKTQDIKKKIKKPFETIKVLGEQVQTCLEFNGDVTFKEIQLES